MRFVRTLFVVVVLALSAAPAAFALRFTDDSYNMPPAYVGQPYSKQFGGAGGCGPALPYQYTLIGGGLPPGLSLSFSGLISGTPTQAGSYSFWVNLSDQNPPSANWCRPATSQREFTIGVSPARGSGPSPKPTAPPTEPLAVASASMPAGEVDAPYAMALKSSGGGAASKTWSVNGGQLPPGLELSPDGRIAGTPTAAGTFSFSVAVHDGTTSASKTFSVAIAPTLTFDASPRLPVAEVRTPYRADAATAIHLGGGTPPYRFAPVSGFPYGIGFDSTAGAVFAMPRQPGTLELTLAVSDARNVTKRVTLTLVVIPRLHIVPIELRRGRVGTRYRARIAVTGGQEPSWSITSGALPRGLRLDAATGVITGTPRRTGTCSFVVAVHDALGAKVAIRYTVRIRG